MSNDDGEGCGCFIIIILVILLFSQCNSIAGLDARVRNSCHKIYGNLGEHRELF